MTYCKFSDLPTDQCACDHCRPSPSAPPATADPFDGSSIVARFSARFDSRCDGCNAPMFEGETIVTRTADGDYICEDCSR